jgi:AmmeMemoRadiSam system protein A
VVVDDDAHAPEHSLEVHLPFLQRTLGEFRLLPLVVGGASAETVAAVLDALWGGPETLVVVSTDLSHYLDHDTAAERDRRTADAIVAGDGDALDPHDACGSYPVRGLLTEAARRGLQARLVALGNSGDTAGPPDRVVGYGAFALEPRVTDTARAALLRLAVDTVAAGIRTRRELDAPAELAADPVLGAPGAAFVTLERDGRLLGCVGGLEAVRPLAAAVARAAFAAAFEDPRLPAVTADDFPTMTVKVSVLSELEAFPVAGYDDLVEALRPGVDGIVVRAGRHRATLLPSVWHQLARPADFVAALWQKAGLQPGAWPEPVMVLRYTTDEFADSGPRAPSIRGL